jgi:hypothetical protein
METRDETVSLISAGKVQGTNVYNTDGDSLGEVYDVMIDKLSGKVAYAIMSFGGFLGVGEPLWTGSLAPIGVWLSPLIIFVSTQPTETPSSTKRHPVQDKKRAF